MKKITRKVKTTKYNIQRANTRRILRIKLDYIDKQCRHLESIAKSDEQLPF
jgi:DNA-binding Xre family transcriptional regulator